MFPNVLLPDDVRAPVDFKLRAGWSYEPAARVFTGPKGRAFRPTGLPRGARVEPKVPSLAAADPASLSAPERKLRRFMHVIPPASAAPETLVETVRSWPCAEDVRLGPVPSLPDAGPPSAP